MRKLSELRIREIFTISLWLKGIHAILELAGGFLLLFVSSSWIIATIDAFAKGELDEDPGSLVAHYFEHLSQTFTTGAQSFAAWYLLIHGAVKIVLIIGLLKNKLWMYPIAMVVFATFALYQAERFVTTHSLFMGILTLLDVVIIVLTWHEYKHRKHLLRRGEFL